MKTNRSVPKSTVIPVLTYPDVRQAVDWLSDAFGFTERLNIGHGHRSQLQVGDGDIIIGDVRGARRAPQDMYSHQVMVRVQDVDAHCERARKHGAKILTEPTDFPYGERQYEAEDPAGHHWILSETIHDVDPKEWGGALRG